MDKLITVVGLILALSVASERLVEIVKGWIPYLNVAQTDEAKEGHRRSWIHVLAVVAGIVTALLSQPVVATVVQLPQPQYLWIFALGLLASGGSSLWNSILTYVLSIKDLKEQVADAAKKGKVDFQRMAGG